MRSDEFTEDIPEAGRKALARELPAGRIYNFQPYGGPLSYWSRGRWQVLMDGRMYVYSDAEWKEYYAAAAGHVSVDELVDRHSPDAFFVHPYVQKGLIERLRAHPQWQEIPGAGVGCCVFVRQQPEATVALRGGP
jgi:hypothetical protein